MYRIPCEFPQRKRTYPSKFGAMIGFWWLAAARGGSLGELDINVDTAAPFVLEFSSLSYRLGDLSNACTASLIESRPPMCASRMQNKTLLFARTYVLHSEFMRAYDMGYCWDNVPPRPALSISSTVSAIFCKRHVASPLPNRWSI